VVIYPCVVKNSVLKNPLHVFNTYLKTGKIFLLSLFTKHTRFAG